MHAFVTRSVVKHNSNNEFTVLYKLHISVYSEMTKILITGNANHHSAQCAIVALTCCSLYRLIKTAVSTDGRKSCVREK